MNLARLWAEAKRDAIADAVQTGHIPVAPGFWLVRVHLRAPEMPARIWFCDHEPGNPENKLDRGPPKLVGQIAGEDCTPADVMRCRERRKITAAEYEFLMAERAWAKEWAPDEAPDPRRAPDLTLLPPIF